MDSVFPGSYGLNEQDKATVLRDGIVSFDANVLLDLYRFSPETRETRFESMQKLSQHERLWITFQAADEFHRRRMKVIRAQDTRARQIMEHFRKLKGEMENVTKEDEHHPALDLHKLKDIAVRAKTDADKVWGAFQKSRVNPSQDSILARLTEIVADRFGQPPDKEAAARWGEEALRRIARGIPPGFADENKVDGGVGDVLIWRELLELGKSQKRPIVFVTSDMKPDWWEHYDAKSKGNPEPIGPHTALVTEMHREAGVLYHQLDLVAFQEFSRDTLSVPTSEAALEELRDNVRDSYASASVPWRFDRPYDFERAFRDDQSDRLLGEMTARNIALATGEVAARAAMSDIERIYRSASGEFFVEELRNQQSEAVRRALNPDI
jgi:hypothetical protein